ncbi:hypothetical protein [Poriferisphaera sp. WC338]|uniref:hypothetical protein n=1 Tax=Poriferisphaera sp. WC338 TaxID=3425129 RepID=UPI003D813B4E
MVDKKTQPITNTSGADGEEINSLSNMKAVVLLAGSVRASSFRRAVKRSLMNLPVTSEQTVIDTWKSQILATAKAHHIESLPIRVMLDRATPMWNIAQKEDERVKINLEQDPFEFRGTGGLMRDLADQYEDDDYLLTANAAQILTGQMTEVIRDLASVRADVTMVCLSDGTPTDIMLLRCGALRSIAKVGFVDLKEQALPQIAKSYDVRVVRREELAGLPIRTLSGYLDGLREYHRKQKGISRDHVLYDEEWRATFELIEPGAAVHESAIIHDSVIMSGAEVQANAVVVRSVVTPSGVVHNGQSAIDMIVDKTVGI